MAQLFEGGAAPHTVCDAGAPTDRQGPINSPRGTAHARARVAPALHLSDRRLCQKPPQLARNDVTRSITQSKGAQTKNKTNPFGIQCSSVTGRRPSTSLFHPKSVPFRVRVNTSSRRFESVRSSEQCKYYNKQNTISHRNLLQSCSSLEITLIAIKP